MTVVVSGCVTVMCVTMPQPETGGMNHKEPIWNINLWAMNDNKL